MNAYSEKVAKTIEANSGVYIFMQNGNIETIERASKKLS